VQTWWSLGRIRAIPVRIHWSALLGLVVFGGFRFAPGAWLGFLLVILVHELGHAAVVRAVHQRVIGIDIHGLGGETRWAGNPTDLERALIACGGVAAQLLMFAVALPLSLALGGSLGWFGADLFYALTWNSLMVAALNLLPFRPFDGAQAWKLPGLLAARPRRNKPAPSTQPASVPRTPDTRDAELANLFAQIASQAREARAPHRR